MRAPPPLDRAARQRVQAYSSDIQRALELIRRRKPGEIETDLSRRSAVQSARSPWQVEGKGGPEAIWGQSSDFIDVAFFERGRRSARSVCRIIARSGEPIGTGFLISPRVLITNNHVIGSASEAQSMLAEFDYEHDLNGVTRTVTRFALAPENLFLTCGQDELDFTVVAVGPRVTGPSELSDYGFLPLSAARNKHALGDFVNIVQHPSGRLKEAVVRENQLVNRGKTVLHYVADTEPGASGSPVFNVLWQVVALHHWGAPHRELTDASGSQLALTMNEGVRTSAIVLEMETQKARVSAAARAMLDEALRLGLEGSAPLPPTEEPENAAPYAAPVRLDEGVATWHIPLEISVKLGRAAPRLALGTNGVAPAAAPTEVPPPVWPSLPERKLEADPDYANRSGYDPAFLGPTIPLPRLSRALKQSAAKNRQRQRGADPYELKYEHFSIVMNGHRRLAFFSAVNIDGARSKDLDRKTGKITPASGLTREEESNGSEAAELWLTDPRISDSEQTPADLFAGQTAFDASGDPITDKRSAAHRDRMFQQGHLTRRQDPLWGANRVVERAHADTFHVTNRAPQVGFFNMGTSDHGEATGYHPGGTLHWRALEDYVLENARADRQRVTVFTGPIFDDQRDLEWSRGRSDLAGFKAPLEFWKLVLRVDDGQLRAVALVADQSELIDYVPETLEEARRVAFTKVAKYQTSVTELERRTGLDFGAQVREGCALGSGERRKLEKVDDVWFQPQRAPQRSPGRTRPNPTKPSSKTRPR